MDDTEATPIEADGARRVGGERHERGAGCWCRPYTEEVQGGWADTYSVDLVHRDIPKQFAP